MTTFNNNSRAISVDLNDITLDHVRLGRAYIPNFADGADGPQWSLMVRADKGTDSFNKLLDLKEAGLPVKMDDETGQLTLNLKQYTQTMKGVAKRVVVGDSDCNILSEEERATIGNGSKGHVAFYYYGYANASGVGYSARLTHVALTEKVDFAPETDEDRIARLFAK